MSTSRDYYKLAEQQRTRAMSPDEVGDNVAIIIVCALIGLGLWWYDVSVWAP